MPVPLFLKQYTVTSTLTAAQLATLVGASGLSRGDVYVISDTNDVVVALTVNTYQTLPTSGGGGAAWGSITGTLSAQSDLNVALTGKQPLDGDLTSLAAASGTNTIYYRNAVDTWSPVTIGTGLSFSGGSLDNTTAAIGGSGLVTVDFGSTFTDKAQLVITGQAWVVAGSKIIAQVRTPTGVDPDEMYLLNFRTQISDLVVGVGFTLTVYTEARARGTYQVSLIGV